MFGSVVVGRVIVEKVRRKLRWKALADGITIVPATEDQQRTLLRDKRAPKPLESSWSVVSVIVKYRETECSYQVEFDTVNRLIALA